MKLYWGPGTCAIGIHALLEEIGVPYDLEEIDVAGDETRGAAFRAINPKAKVPTLVRDDGSVLTEFAAIATWLARIYPEKLLIPADAECEARIVEMLSYIGGTTHGLGFARLFSPKLFEPQDMVRQATGLGVAAVKAQGMAIVEQGFALLDIELSKHEWLVGDTLTIADFALFYVARWAPQHDITLPVNVQRHLDRMFARPAVHKVRQLWGEV